MHSNCAETGRALCLGEACRTENTVSRTQAIRNALIVHRLVQARQQTAKRRKITPPDSDFLYDVNAKQTVSYESVRSVVRERQMHTEWSGIAIAPPPPELTVEDEKKLSLKVPFTKREHVKLGLDICSRCLKRSPSHTLLFCWDCGDGYHAACVAPRCDQNAISISPWQCNKCRVCSECLSSEKQKDRLVCELCDREFHWFCLGFQEKDILNARGAYIHCSRCFEKSEDYVPPKCFICHKDRNGSNWIRCSSCRHGLHKSCERVRALDHFYKCAVCRGDVLPEVENLKAIRFKSSDKDFMDEDENSKSFRFNNDAIAKILNMPDLSMDDLVIPEIDERKTRKNQIASEDTVPAEVDSSSNGVASPTPPVRTENPNIIRIPRKK